MYAIVDPAHIYGEALIRLSLVYSPANPYAVRTEVALELRRICLSDCWSFIDLFSKADLEFPWVVDI